MIRTNAPSRKTFPGLHFWQAPGGWLVLTVTNSVGLRFVKVTGMVKATCMRCKTVSTLPDHKVPIGRSYILCPTCSARINIFKSVRPGTILKNLYGMRFQGPGEELADLFSEPGEQWRVVKVVEPCPDKGKGRACELQNRGRCPNQRLLVRRRKEVTVYKTCLYRQGRRLFEKGGRVPVGKINTSTAVLPPSQEDLTTEKSGKENTLI